MLLRYFIALCLLVFPAAVFAQEAEDIVCHYDGTQAELNVCAHQDHLHEDKILNTLYRRLMSSLPDAKKRILRLEQRRWVKHKEQHCTEQANEVAEGGTMWPMIYDSCLTDITKRRTGELQKLK